MNILTEDIGRGPILRSLCNVPLASDQQFFSEEKEKILVKFVQDNYQENSKKILGLNIGIVIFYRSNGCSLQLIFLIKIQTQKEKKVTKPVLDMGTCKPKAIL